jgi:hypothetical protein
VENNRLEVPKGYGQYLHRNKVSTW